MTTGADIEKLEPSCTAGKNVKLMSGISSKV